MTLSPQKAGQQNQQQQQQEEEEHAVITELKSFSESFILGTAAAISAAKFFEYTVKNRALRDIAFAIFQQIGFVVCSFFILEKLVGQDGFFDNSIAWFLVQACWVLPVTIIVEWVGVGGWNLYWKLYAAAWVQAKTQGEKVGGVPPNVDKGTVVIGENVVKSLVSIIVVLFKVVLIVWSSFLPSILPEFLLEWIFPNSAIREVVKFSFTILIQVLIFLLDTLYYSFFCFDVRMAKTTLHQKQLSLSEQLLWFQSYWPFFVGFGVPQYALARAANYYGGHIFQTLVLQIVNPINVVTALPCISSLDHPKVSKIPMRIFSVAEEFATKFLQFLEWMFKFD